MFWHGPNTRAETSQIGLGLSRRSFPSRRGFALGLGLRGRRTEHLQDGTVAEDLRNLCYRGSIRRPRVQVGPEGQQRRNCRRMAPLHGEVQCGEPLPVGRRDAPRRARGEELEGRHVTTQSSEVDRPEAAAVECIQHAGISGCEQVEGFYLTTFRGEECQILWYASSLRADQARQHIARPGADSQMNGQQAPGVLERQVRAPLSQQSNDCDVAHGRRKVQGACPLVFGGVIDLRALLEQ
mmetsp:Transcript_150790/g.482612  ORF Transcript_150790/g.482612 Transcript_150790/m.482612 type:complete len:239 (+) Transcript_150790:405-1121(+)